MGCSWFNTETNKRKTSINNKKHASNTSIKNLVMRPNLQLQHSNSITRTYVCNYKVQFCAFKGDAQNLPLRRVGRREISPLEELVGERSPPSSSQRLTGMGEITRVRLNETRFDPKKSHPRYIGPKNFYTILMH